MIMESEWDEVLGVYASDTREGTYYHCDPAAPFNEWYRDPADALRAQVASLSSQLERLRDELEQEHVSHTHEYNWRIELEASVERLKADSERLDWWTVNRITPDFSSIPRGLMGLREAIDGWRERSVRRLSQQGDTENER